jgi:hypothetical protein
LITLSSARTKTLGRIIHSMLAAVRSLRPVGFRVFNDLLGNLLGQASSIAGPPDLYFHSTKNKGPTGGKPIGPMNYDSNLLPKESQPD